MLGGLTGLGRRFTPVGYVERRKKFIFSGNGTADAIDRFLAVRVITVALVPIIFIVMYIWNPFNLEGLVQFLAFVLLSFARLVGPDAILSTTRSEERQHAMQVQLPDVLDFL